MSTFQALSRFFDFFACGDAIGKATEFMTLGEIKKKIGRITGLVDPALSQNHSDLKRWEVTDDTEQNLYLLRRYLKDGKVSIDNTVEALTSWIEETNAVAKKYIGPSSQKALDKIKNEGADPLTTGLSGTTCGGIMRSPSAVFASILLNQDINDCVYNALVPTHNTSQSMEAAFAYAYALKAALENKPWFPAALEGCKVGVSKSPYEAAEVRLSSRLEFLSNLNLPNWKEDKLKSFLYGVLGTGLASYETASAVFALALHTSSPNKAIFLASETGGDTDTIAALAGGLISILNPDEEPDFNITKEIKGHINLAFTDET